MSSSEIKELQKDLRSGRDAVLASVEGVSEAEAHQIPEPGEWTVAQLVAHITELQPFWISKAVLITQVDDPQITRTAVENDERLAAVTDHSQEGLASLIQQMNAVNDQVVEVVGGIDPAKLDRPGHREDNPMTAAGVIQYVARHVRLHADQIIESLRLIRQ
ncbi:MAG: DinB family protein, partial [Acidobacteria bacterium]|nr:DinB family protein [Acidobacteriota bacterium]